MLIFKFQFGSKFSLTKSYTEVLEIVFYIMIAVFGWDVTQCKYQIGLSLVSS